MLTRLQQSLLFRLEQIVMRGALARFAVLLALVLFVALGAGVLVRAIAPGFESVGEAIWWAFLRERGARRLRVAVLTERAGPTLMAELRQHLMPRHCRRCIRARWRSSPVTTSWCS